MFFIWVGALLILVALSAALTGWVRSYARTRLLDMPNTRSSHQQPTPRGGGLAIVVTFALALLALRGLDALPVALLLALSGLAPLAVVGFIDDHGHVSARWRLLIQVAAGLWALFWLGSLDGLTLAGRAVELGWFGPVLATLGIVWMQNLYNFMDGIDGIAGVETLGIALPAAGLMLWTSGGALPGEAAAALALAAATAGFLIWNWPPARIFMGDVGSAVLGFVLAVLMLGSAVQHSLGFGVWLILSGVFLIDATVTLLTRMWRGERWHEAHRSHAYQHAARRWGGHRPVILAVLAINTLWLLPLAGLAVAFPPWELWLLALAWLPLIVIAFRLGAGRS